jgi:predicted acylesterase/phospholipase RssA
MAPRDRQVAIVLQGGGALGAYELGVLKRLYEQKDFRPSVVSGVSVGAVTAATLVGAKNGDPVKTLADMWDEFEVYSSPLVPDSVESVLSVLGNPSFYLPRGDYYQFARWTSFYRTDPLRATIERHVDFGRIADSDIQLILTATDVETGQVRTFDNRDRGPLKIEHVLASASLPPAFPMTRISERSFWDGGLFDNTPLSPVIKVLNPERDAQLIVVNLFPSAGPVPRNIPEVFGRTIQILLANKMQNNVELTLEVTEYVQLVNAIKGKPELVAELRDLPGFQRLARYKLLENIVYITNSDQESPNAFFDFSAAAIARRVASGYRDADAALRRPLSSAADIARMRSRRE